VRVVARLRVCAVVIFAFLDFLHEIIEETRTPCPLTPAHTQVRLMVEKLMQLIYPMYYPRHGGHGAASAGDVAMASFQDVSASYSSSAGRIRLSESAKKLRVGGTKLLNRLHDRNCYREFLVDQQWLAPYWAVNNIGSHSLCAYVPGHDRGWVHLHGYIVCERGLATGLVGIWAFTCRVDRHFEWRMGRIYAYFVYVCIGWCGSWVCRVCTGCGFC
jgi:hypothetical protein